MNIIRTASSEFGTYCLCEKRRFRRACASAQSRQNLGCSLIQSVSQEEQSDRKPDPWPRWMTGHAQLKFVMTECSKTQIRLTGFIRCRQNGRTMQTLRSSLIWVYIVCLDLSVQKLRIITVLWFYTHLYFPEKVQPCRRLNLLGVDKQDKREHNQRYYSLPLQRYIGTRGIQIIPRM